MSARVPSAWVPAELPAAFASLDILAQAEGAGQAWLLALEGQR